MKDFRIEFTPPMPLGYTYTAPTQPLDEPEKLIYDAERYPESSNTIMCHDEVLDYFQKKRTTIISWRKNRNFPEPISKSPLRWLRASVMQWVEHEGGFKV